LQSLQKNCNGDYVNVDNRNVLCSRDMSSFDEVYICIHLFCFIFMKILWEEFLFAKVNSNLLFSQATSGLNPFHILDPDCMQLDEAEKFPRRSLIKKNPSIFLDTNLKLPPLSCRVMLLFRKFMQCNDNLTIYTICCIII